LNCTIFFLLCKHNITLESPFFYQFLGTRGKMKEKRFFGSLSGSFFQFSCEFTRFFGEERFYRKIIARSKNRRFWNGSFHRRFWLSDKGFTV